jgi:opacity protein-like surface antigen
MLMSSQATDNQGSFRLEFDPALQGSAVAGWDLAPDNPVGEGRVELEYSRRSNQLHQVKFVEGSFNGDGKVTADSLLLSAYGVFRDKRFWSPYVGAGIGAARMEASGLKVTGQPMGSGTSVVLAYQLGAGLDLELTRRVSLDLGYRFFGSTQPKFTETSGRSFKMDYFSHSAVFGLRYGF